MVMTEAQWDEARDRVTEINDTVRAAVAAERERIRQLAVKVGAVYCGRDEPGSCHCLMHRREAESFADLIGGDS